MKTTRVALISGAGEEPGRSLALALAQAGWRVALNDRTPVRIEPLAEEIIQSGGDALTFVGESHKGLPAHELVDEVLTEWARIDLLVHALHVQPPAPLLDLDEWDWTHTLEVNLSGMFLLNQAAGRIMREQGSGLILTTIFNPPGAPAITRACAAARRAISAAAAPEFLTYNINMEVLEAEREDFTAAALRWASDCLPPLETSR